jgi:hypothetical protein
VVVTGFCPNPLPNPDVLACPKALLVAGCPNAEVAVAPNPPAAGAAELAPIKEEE